MQQKCLKDTFKLNVFLQTFNCNEIGLYYCLLCHKTLAGSLEKREDGIVEKNQLKGVCYSECMC